MRFTFQSVVLAAVLLATGFSLMAAEKAASPAARQFEMLKQLAGDWVELDQDGKPTDKLISSIRVTSAGSAIQETLFPGGDHEMITMYFLDGDDLVLTHYCALGNQPHMRAEPSENSNQIDFKFVSTSNLKSPDEQRMAEASFTVLGPDRFKARWVSSKQGETCCQASFDLTRKQK